MTRHDKAVMRAIRRYCKSHGIKPLKISHIYPRAYIRGVKPLGLDVSLPWVDSEHAVKQLSPKDPVKTITMFDPSLHAAGMWCSAAYVMTKNWGQMVAIPVVPRP